MLRVSFHKCSFVGDDDAAAAGDDNEDEDDFNWFHWFCFGGHGPSQRQAFSSGATSPRASLKDRYLVRPSVTGILRS